MPRASSPPFDGLSASVQNHSAPERQCAQRNLLDAGRRHPGAHPMTHFGALIFSAIAGYLAVQMARAVAVLM